MPVPTLTIHPGPPPAWERTLWTLSAPSRIEDKADLMAALSAQMRERSLLDEEEGFWFSLCLDEALTNAILHGNEADDTMSVTLRLGIDAGCWMVAIDDQGGGFAAHDVPDQDDDASLALEHGRGIRLMREWLSRLTWWRGGATIEFGRECQSVSCG